VIRVDDPDDPRLVDYIGLTDAALRRNDIFMVEGALAIRHLIASNFTMRSALVAPNRVDELGDVDVPVYVADLSVMQKVAGFNIHRGMLASAERPAPTPMADVMSTSTRLAILEGINDHENLGVIFRNAAGLGMHGVLLCPRCCDPLYRRSIRVSTGHILRMPFATVDPWPHALDAIRAAGFTVLALTPDASAVAIEDVELDADAKVAVLLGAEGNGLSDAALATAHIRVRIPMGDGVDSLNVGSAAAIAFHAVSRRRGTAPGRI
jgi:tRNA G18 (ribose-2'-O)-methylase SpoU